MTQKKQGYYHLNLGRIAVGKEHSKFRHPDTCQGKFSPPVQTYAHDENWWRECYQNYPQDDGEYMGMLTVEDNGQYGDGVQLVVHAGSEDQEQLLAFIDVPDESLPVLIAALQAVQLLRQAQGPEEADQRSAEEDVRAV